MAVAHRRSSFVHFKHRNVPDRELVRDLRRVAREADWGRVTAHLYVMRGKFNIVTLSRRFGTWNAALDAARLPVSHRRGVTNAELLENLAVVWRKLGRQPGVHEIAVKGGVSKFGSSIYERRFGSWHKALSAFERFMNGRRRRDAPLPSCPAPVVRAPRDIGWRLRATVLIRDNCLCRMCGASPAKDSAVTLQVDHIVPWSKGGATELGNLQTLCAVCNIGKGDLG